VTLDGEQGVIAVYEPLAGKNLGTGVIVDPQTVVRTTRLAATDKHGKNENALIIVRPDDRGTVSYRSGFACAGDGDITNETDWISHLKAEKP
jgi:hypothetical protein